MSPAPLRLGQGLLGGLVGTATMTLTTALERRARGDVDGPIDYDASRHVTTAVATVLRREPHGDAERRGYYALAHWGYGSAVAVVYPALRRRLGGRRAPVVLWAGCQTMAFTLLPMLGGTPPAWRWRRDRVLTSVGQHAVYAASVAVATWAVDRSRSSPVQDAVSDRAPDRPAA